MQLKETKIYNFDGAFRGMRNPMNSWNKSDSYFGIFNIYNSDILTDVCHSWISLEPIDYDSDYYNKLDEYERWLESNGILDCTEHGEIYSVAFIGPKDLKLAQKLILAGEEHAKFMRQIFVSVDITAPLYWWKEFDTYKVGTVANSTSTMHKLAAEPITKNMFEFDGNNGDLITVSTGKSICGDWELVFSDYIDDIIDMCENLRRKYIETKDAMYWRALIQILPSAYLQTRTVTMSYANLRNIYFQRRNHKLIEWHEFCDWIKLLPYSEDLITIGE